MKLLRVCVSLGDELWFQSALLAAASGRSRSELVRDLLTDYIERQRAESDALPLTWPDLHNERGAEC